MKTATLSANQTTDSEKATLTYHEQTSVVIKWFISNDEQLNKVVYNWRYSH